MITIERVTMFTPASLLEMAAEREALLNSGQWVATDCKIRMRKEIEDALACAIWMEKNGHKELEYVGPFGEVLFEKGEKVRVKAGAHLSSTNPKYSRAKGGKTVARNYAVKIQRAHAGYVLHGEVHQGCVVWAGEGCYWYETDLNNVEPV